ncbi:MAG: phosphoglycerate dehydrogenase [Elusimicrobia bacterium]|nr:phosphoglycerate dehydrogenase [Elusimicrobiota bacterium]
MPEEKYFIIDFDSTFTQVEALDELATISLRGRPDREQAGRRVRELTRLGMEGKIPFGASLARRLRLLRADRRHIDALIGRLKKRITKSVARNREFFRKYAGNIYVVSGGFREFMLPVLAPLGIPEANVFGNTFVFDQRGRVVGFDKSNPLCQDGGKARQVERLGLRGDVCIIGDGKTDHEMKKACPGSRFFAFTENVRREAAVRHADSVAPSFDEFLYANKLPTALSYPKNRIKVLLLEGVSPEAVSQMREEGYSVESLPQSLPDGQLAARLADVHILGIRSRTQIGEASLAEARRLLCMGVFCIGTNNVDLGACTRKATAVFNAPFSSTRSVAEMTVGEIVMLVRGIFDKSTRLHAGTWDKSPQGAFEVRGKKLGIVGYGNIGSQVSILAEGLGMDVLYYDVADKLALGNARKCRSMMEVLKKADVVTIHVDGGPMNDGLIGEKEFRAMKPGSSFLNLSRGRVVDLAALARCLKAGRLRGAAIDVFPEEPRGNGQGFVSELQGMPQAILTPHIGGSTIEAQENIARFVTDRVIGFVNSGDTLHSVNFPQLRLPRVAKSHRFLHIHKNVPGMLSQINTVFSDHRINIEGQYLKTNDEIGYVITDICAKYDEGVMAALKLIPGTIRFRVLY